MLSSIAVGSRLKNSIKIFPKDLFTNMRIEDDDHDVSILSKFINERSELRVSHQH